MPTPWKFNCDNLVLCPATRTAEQNRLGVIHAGDKKENECPRERLLRRKRAPAGGSLGRGPGVARAGRNNSKPDRLWFKSAISNAAANDAGGLKARADSRERFLLVQQLLWWSSRLA